MIRRSSWLVAASAAALLSACATASPPPPATVAEAPPAPAPPPRPQPQYPPFGFDMAAMDRSVAPGDDFFAYANGAWVKATEIPADRSNLTSFAVIAETAAKRTQTIIEDSARSNAPDGSEARKIGDYYASFMDEASIEQKGAAPLRPELGRIAAIASRRDLSRELGATLRADVDALNATDFYTDRIFGLWVAEDLNDTTKYRPYLMQGGLGMPDREYYLGDTPRYVELRAKYKAEPTFFDPNADAAINYGAIGGVIGHEVSHGFDDLGAQFDAEGNLRNWWTAQDMAQFKQRTKRLADQYSAYQVFPDLKLNGEQVLGENIADVAGLATAYDAYHLSLNGQPAPVIDGVSADQRFFLGWAQNYRSKYREAALRRAVVTGVHSPGPYRALTVRNLDAWYPAFQVQPGQTLYLAPADRVRIW